MKDKYVESRFPIWFVFGEHLDGVNVDIADSYGDVAVRIPREQAVVLINEHNRTIEALIDAVRLLSSDDQSAWLERHNLPKEKK